MNAHRHGGALVVLLGALVTFGGLATLPTRLPTAERLFAFARTVPDVPIPVAVGAVVAGLLLIELGGIAFGDGRRLSRHEFE